MIENDLTKGRVSRQLVRYAIPMISTSVLQALYSLIDLMIVGQFLGSDAVSAVNNATLIINLLTQIIIGFTIGGNILIGQYYGSKRNEDYRKSCGTLFTLCAVCGVAFVVVFRLLARPLLIMIDAPALELATTYLQICVFGLFFIFGYNALSAILRALGNSKKPLLFILVSTTVNILLDLLFVAHLNMGVAGAALATLIAQIISFSLALHYVWSNRAQTGFTKEYLGIHWDKAKKILKIGFPTALQWTAASLSWVVVAFLINQHGVDVSAGNGISNKIKEFCQIFTTATVSAGATMAAQNIGAGDYERAKEVLRSCLRMTLGIATCLIVVVQLLAPLLVGLFIDDAVVAQHAILNLRIEIIAQIFYAGFMSFNVLATGSGDTLFVMANSFLNCIVARLVLAVLLESLLGAVGIYIACLIAPSVSVPVAIWYYKSRRWARGNVLE